MELIKLLMSDPRVNPADYDNYCVGIAASAGFFDIMRELLKGTKFLLDHF